MRHHPALTQENDHKDNRSRKGQKAPPIQRAQNVAESRDEVDVKVKHHRRVPRQEHVSPKRRFTVQNDKHAFSEVSWDKHLKNCRSINRWFKLVDTRQVYDSGLSIKMCMDVRQSVAIDCEMVGTGPSGKSSTLGRVSLVDWHGRVLLDTHVKVHDTVTDLRTSISGITWDQINPASRYAMEYEDCVSLVKRLIKGRILVGHALQNDLNVLGITHPWNAIRDTATYEPLMRAHGEILLPRKLKDLSYERLGLVIQNSDSGHSSVEDAWAAMKLYSLLWPHWETTLQHKNQNTWEMKLAPQPHPFVPQEKNSPSVVVRCS